MRNIRYTLIAILSLLLTADYACAQKNPDTLVINTKNGQVILVSDSLKKFITMPMDMLIRKAIYQVLDSLPNDKSLKAKKKTQRDSLYTRIIKKRMFRITESFGIGLIRDKVSPLVGVGIEFAPQKQDYFRKNGGMYTFINLSAHAAFTFREVENKYRTYQNTFLDATIGNRINPAGGYKSVTELSAGIGYLIQRNGNYFDRNTFKIFANIGLPTSFIVIRPECYLSKGNVFPGLTIKLINITNYY